MHAVLCWIRSIADGKRVDRRIMKYLREYVETDDCIVVR